MLLSVNDIFLTKIYAKSYFRVGVCNLRKNIKKMKNNILGLRHD